MKLFKRNHYEKMFAKKPKTVQELQFEIQALQAKVLELQSKCDHPSTYPAMWMSRPGSFQPALVCNSCNAHAGYPSEAESKSLREQFYGPNASSASSICWTEEKK